MHKRREKNKLTHRHRHKICSRKSFLEKTQQEGEVALLSFYVWKTRLQVQINNVCGPWAAAMHRSSMCALPPISSRYLCSTMEKNSLERIECLFLLVTGL